MPRISEFYGIIIEMYWSDHNPPHFHAKYAEHRAEIDIRTLGILRGRLPAKAAGLVTEWASLHQDELLAQWERARNHEPLDRIEPLL
ncbi:MAG: DUF4160 domain-containing protein [Pirellulales bacterium]